MIEEYGGVAQFSSLLVKSGIYAFLAAEQALGEIPWTRHWDKTTVTMEPVGVAGLITAWNANVLFICLKLASAVAAGCTVVIKPSELSSLHICHQPVPLCCVAALPMRWSHADTHGNAYAFPEAQ